MDERDIEILKVLFELGDPSPKQIAAETGVPKSTVHYRLGKLREAGILKNDLYDVDLTEAGLGITVITEVMAEYEEDYQKTTGEKLAAIEGVSGVYFTMGDTDFVVIAHLPNSQFVSRLINSYEAVDGVSRTSSKFVITTIKNEPNPFNNYSLDTLQSVDLSTSGAFD
ncbi:MULTISPECIES: Lrp/AsnC family transcriptional regulator [unclassified Haladaptatus]|uniref:Lrp/AsnC family transcriptional regulator n=1 Tax=unclassified Haladaptatus TaxID=2622732 RepID=UPI0023E88C94|nr:MULTISPECIES: Lrp/AsnC family transcriptional regulator [unclassified Haladaptatus]